jgi:hypothetical protein
MNEWRRLDSLALVPVSRGTGPRGPTFVPSNLPTTPHQVTPHTGHQSIFAPCLILLEIWFLSWCRRLREMSQEEQIQFLFNNCKLRALSLRFLAETNLGNTIDYGRCKAKAKWNRFLKHLQKAYKAVLEQIRLAVSKFLNKSTGLRLAFQKSSSKISQCWQLPTFEGQVIHTQDQQICLFLETRDARCRAMAGSSRRSVDKYNIIYNIIYIYILYVYYNII